MLLVEHDMPMVMSIAGHVVVVNSEVITAYLGTEDDPVGGMAA